MPAPPTGKGAEVQPALRTQRMPLGQGHRLPQPTRLRSGLVGTQMHAADANCHAFFSWGWQRTAPMQFSGFWPSSFSACFIGAAGNEVATGCDSCSAWPAKLLWSVATCNSCMSCNPSWWHFIFWNPVAPAKISFSYCFLIVL